MSQLLARILLALFVIPMGCLVYLVSAVKLEQWLDQKINDWHDAVKIRFFLSGVITWILVAIWWFLLWRKSVKWNAARFWLTAACASGAAAFGMLSAGILDATRNGQYWYGFGAFVGSMAAPLLWLVGTIFVWRETAGERAARVDRSGRDTIVCPTCGYNLTGLKESRCPECGTQFTLDQLLASQPGKATAEIEG